MLIPIPTGTYRVAVCAAIKAAEDKLASDKSVISERSFTALHDGAVHNGLKPSDKDIAEMHAMVERDMEHMMESHPAQETLAHFNNHLAMLDFAAKEVGNELVIDDHDFRLIKPYLP